ncbi:MAG: DsbA family protein [Motiliproteus sp.]
MLYRDFSSPPLSPCLIYVMDPMCSWCWAFAPALRELKTKLPSSIPCHTLLGGLAPDSTEPMPEAMQQQIKQIWQHIEGRTGAQFNYDFWTTNTPRRSTYNACRAVIAAGEQLTDRSDEMIEAIQQGYYLNANNPSDTEVLVGLAEAIGLNPAAYRDRLLSPATETLLQQHLSYKDALGIQGFPCLLWFNGKTFEWLSQGYTEANQLLARMEGLGIGLMGSE